MVELAHVDENVFDDNATEIGIDLDSVEVQSQQFFCLVTRTFSDLSP